MRPAKKISSGRQLSARWSASWRSAVFILCNTAACSAFSPEWQSLIESGAALDETVRSLYGRRRAAIACCGWTILSLILNSGEIYIALWALNLHATIANAIILQSMALTIRSVAFPVPGGLGVQEGGYVLVGNLLGIPGETAFALSLIARVRELALGIPGLIAWQLIEGRRLLRTRVADIPS